MLRNVLRSFFVGTVLAVTPLVAHATKANDTLVYASDSEPENVSPYHNSLREGVILGRLAWDSLLYRDPATGAYKPLLAVKWNWVDPTTLDLTLRTGVTFHNGDPLGPDDVVFTFNTMLKPESKVVTKQNIDWLSSAEKRPDGTVRLHLKAPFPAALEFLAGPTPIYPAAYYQKVGLAGFAKAPIGSGPYKIVSVTSGRGIKLQRFDGYFADGPKGKAKIAKLEFRVIPDSDARVAAVLTGAVDWTWRIPHDQAVALIGTPGVTVVSAETIRIGFVELDTRGNAPMRDVKVRQAINMAIDRKGMVDNLVGGTSHVIDALCFAGQAACDQSAATPYPYDPKKAKALLAEAGYPNGFDTEIQAYRERDYAEAIVGYLQVIGIRAKLNYLKFATVRDNLRAGSAPMALMTWGSFGVLDASNSTGVYFKGGDEDIWRDAGVIKTLTEADATVDPAARKTLYRVALKRIADQAYTVPLFTYSADYVFSSALDFTPNAEELPLFYASSWK